MAMIHVNRSGTSLGVFSEEDVRAGLRAGRFAPTDLAWREGMAQWQPLSQFAEFAADIPTAAASPPLPIPPGTTTPPSAMVPAGTVPPAARSGLPWENRQTRGFFPAFFDTLVMVLTKPTEAFVAMRREGGLADPLIYGLIGGCFGCLVYTLFMLVMPSVGMMGDHGNSLGGIIGGGFGIISIILIPVGLTIGFFIGAAIVHVCLMIVGGANQSFETTFRVLCFTIGSTYPLFLVPICGAFISGIWGLVVEIIGLARAHETDIGRAVLAVFLPVIVCCGFGILGGIMIPALFHSTN